MANVGCRDLMLNREEILVLLPQVYLLDIYSIVPFLARD